jgi:hypothetical protein
METADMDEPSGSCSSERERAPAEDVAEVA